MQTSTSPVKGYTPDGSTRTIPVRAHFTGNTATIFAIREFDVAEDGADPIGLLPAAMLVVPADRLQELPCRVCSECDGQHHWIGPESLDPSDPQDSLHPALKADPPLVPDVVGHLWILSCKHCDAWIPCPDDWEEDEDE